MFLDCPIVLLFWTLFAAVLIIARVLGLSSSPLDIVRPWRPTHALGLLLCLALNMSVYWRLTLPVFDHVSNKACTWIRMPYVSSAPSQTVVSLYFLTIISFVFYSNQRFWCWFSSWLFCSWHIMFNIYFLKSLWEQYVWNQCCWETAQALMLSMYFCVLRVCLMHLLAAALLWETLWQLYLIWALQEHDSEQKRELDPSPRPSCFLGMETEAE